MLVEKFEVTIRVHHTAPYECDVGVVLGKSLAHPEKRRGLSPVIPVWNHGLRTQSLHVPQVKDLVRRYARQNNTAYEARVVQPKVRILVLERRTLCMREDDQRPVVAIGNLTEDVRHGRNALHFLSPELRACGTCEFA